MVGNFDIGYEGQHLSVSEHHIGGGSVFHVVFADNTEPLVLTLTKGPSSSFWTSIPEGRQNEAEAIGELIANKIKFM